MINLKKIQELRKLAEGSVGYHTTIAQTAKGLSTKHKHTSLAMKAKAKLKPPALGANMVVPANEEAELDEAVSKAKDLKTLLSRHSELAIAANKDGDHEAVKYHQAKMNAVKNQMAKLAKN